MDSETNDPLSMDSYKLKDTNSLVEEFMLLANTLVAKRITEAFPKTAVLRMGIAAMRLCSSAEHVRSITAILLEGLHSDQIDFLRTAKNPPDF